MWPEVKCRLRTFGPDLRTGKGLRLVLGFLLRVSIRVSIRVKIKVRLASAFYPIAGLQSVFNPWPQYELSLGLYIGFTAIMCIVLL